MCVASLLVHASNARPLAPLLRVLDASSSLSTASCSPFETRISWEFSETGAIQNRKYCTAHQPHLGKFRHRSSPTSSASSSSSLSAFPTLKMRYVHTHRRVRSTRYSRLVRSLVTARFASSPISSKVLSTDHIASSKHPVTAPSVSSPASAPRAIVERSSPSQRHV